MITEAKQICPGCGKPLPSDMPLGLCPRCLIQAGFNSQTASGAATGFTPLPIEQIAKLFPQLEFIALIGKGGMGAVYQARQPALDRFVAVKILPPGAAGDPGFAERFNREARALAKLAHPNIVAIHDFGVAGGLHYLIMEYVDGGNLRQIEKAGRLAPEQALAIVPQICDALQFAHNEGIVHRDIKPENILLDKKGHVKITDFGIAKILGVSADRTSLTGAKDVVGTPHYMAPEQIERPTLVDHRADIFSLGVVFYEMLTGELPLGKFAAPSTKVQMDVRLDEVVLHALEKEPQRRYQQASEVKTEVQTIATTPPGAGREPAAAQDPTGWVQALLAVGALLSGSLVLLAITALPNPANLPANVIVMMLGTFGLTACILKMGGVGKSNWQRRTAMLTQDTRGHRLGLGLKLAIPGIAIAFGLMLLADALIHWTGTPSGMPVVITPATPVAPASVPKATDRYNANQPVPASMAVTIAAKIQLAVQNQLKAAGATYDDLRVAVTQQWTDPIVVNYVGVRNFTSADGTVFNNTSGKFTMTHVQGQGWQWQGVLSGTQFTAQIGIVDNIDLPFVNDPDVIGAWTSVDFVADKPEFNPGKKKWNGELFLKGLTFLEGGKMSESWMTWWKGVVINAGAQTASHYDIQVINGQRYLFYEWKSGDVTLMGAKPSYYVLRFSGPAGKP